MSLADVVRGAVAIANGVTAGLQVDVTHTPAGTTDWRGAVTPGTPVTRTAIVEEFIRLYKMSDGTEVASRHKVTFLENVTMQMGDSLVLPGGMTGPILDIDGMLDPAGGRYLTVVVLGDLVASRQ